MIFGKLWCFTHNLAGVLYHQGVLSSNYAKAKAANGNMRMHATWQDLLLGGNHTTNIRHESTLRPPSATCKMHAMGRRQPGRERDRERHGKTVKDSERQGKRGQDV